MLDSDQIEYGFFRFFTLELKINNPAQHKGGEMPYIEQKRRDELVYYLSETPGELNFKITEMVNDYLFGKCTGEKPICYSTINEVIGALECCKLELYRKLSWYEEQKEKENGSVLDKQFTGKNK